MASQFSEVNEGSKLVGEVNLVSQYKNWWWNYMSLCFVFEKKKSQTILNNSVGQKLHMQTPQIILELKCQNVVQSKLWNEWINLAKQQDAILSAWTVWSYSESTNQTEERKWRMYGGGFLLEFIDLISCLNFWKQLRCASLQYTDRLPTLLEISEVKFHQNSQCLYGEPFLLYL